MPRERFKRLVAGQVSAAPVLPLVHTTDVYGFANAIEDGRLVPEGCNVFVGEPLLYFFYGRPSYRVNAREEATSVSNYLPITLIFRNDAVRPIKRIFPFDSGGFVREHYVGALHRRMELLDFGLEADPSTPGRVISLFFENIDAYLLARPIGTPAIDPMQVEAASYAELINHRLPNSTDNRGSGVELQFEGPLNLAGCVEAVVLPGPLADSPTLKQELNRLGITPLPYKQIDRMKPSEYVHTIFDTCYRYYRDLGLIV